MVNKILILFAHPALEKSRINKELIQVIKNIEGVTFRDLYESYPDFHIDVRMEQMLLLEHDLIVLQHPFYWYSCPAIIKEWIDLVLEYGFAYGHNGAALKGKKVMTAITTGGSEDSYNEGGVHRYPISEYLKVFERTAKFCDMDYLPPFVVHNTSELHVNQDISVYKDLYQEVITALRDGEVDFNSLSRFKYINYYFSDLYESRGD